MINEISTELLLWLWYAPAYELYMLMVACLLIITLPVVRWIGL